MRLRPPVKVELKDQDAELARRNHAEQIAELQGLPAMGLVVLPDVQLADGIVTPIAHKLGRKPRWHCCSSPRNATTTGRIVEVRSAAHDRTKVIALTATGWGATITVDVGVL